MSSAFQVIFNLLFIFEKNKCLLSMINSLKRFFFCFWLTAKFFFGETWVNIILRPLGLIITFRYVLKFLMKHFSFSFYPWLSYQQIAMFRRWKICHYIMTVLFKCLRTKKKRKTNVWNKLSIPSCMSILLYIVMMENCIVNNKKF